MEEENVLTEKQPDLGKFKSVDALLRAYGELEAEFTRRSQRLRALEEEKKANASGASAPEAAAASQGDEKAEAAPSPSGQAQPRGSEELYRAIQQDGEVRTRVIADYLSQRGVPLLGGSGRGVPAPADRPRSIAEAGNLALGYLKIQH